jgi:hypothetical protein
VQFAFEGGLDLMSISEGHRPFLYAVLGSPNYGKVPL